MIEFQVSHLLFNISKAKILFYVKTLLKDCVVCLYTLLAVWSFDTESECWSLMDAKGDIPVKKFLSPLNNIHLQVCGSKKQVCDYRSVAVATQW